MAERTWSLGGTLRGMFQRDTVEEVNWDDLEDALLAADFGPDLAEGLIAEVRSAVSSEYLQSASDVKDALRQAIEKRLSRFDPTLQLSEKPAVVLVVGVNGVGKTTTIGKLARFLKSFDRSVVIAAADTFRAAAVDQLDTWARRAEVAIVRPGAPGQDPASVAFQAVADAQQRNTDVVLVDTAGRLHTKGGLMDELSKIRRVVEKQAPVAEVLLVLDATTGQNGLLQAQAFVEHAGVTGLVLTKLDGSAKGGFVVAVQEQTGIPVKLVGQGESIGDLTGFTPRVFAQALFS